jgi:predicted RNA binding protein YcfA (HicA-like mRNA interferase family)
MKLLSGKEFVSLLKKHGWTVQRIKGSHHVMTKPGEQARISVPVHASKTLKTGIQKHFMKIAGLTENDL